jgi:hypothetical protein
MEQYGVIYIINNKIRDGEEIFKIGRTHKLNQRLKELNGETSNIGQFKAVAFFHVSDTVKAEDDVHKALQQFRIQGNREFFKGDQSEIINIVQSIVAKYELKNFTPNQVEKNYKEECKSPLLLAEQGNAVAQSNLGTMYVNGQGVPQDYILAHMWFNLAGSREHEKSVEFKDRIEKKMSPSQIEKAQEMARNWKPKK